MLTKAAIDSESISVLEPLDHHEEQIISLQDCYLTQAHTNLRRSAEAMQTSGAGEKLSAS
jgi:hypothetical protein